MGKDSNHYTYVGAGAEDCICFDEFLLEKAQTKKIFI